MLDKSLLSGPGRGALPATVMTEPVGPCQDALDWQVFSGLEASLQHLRVPFENSLGKYMAFGDLLLSPPPIFSVPGSWL